MASKLGFQIVVAATRAGGIGLKGGLPWASLPGDMAYFRALTSTAGGGRQNAVIMGRRTWESIPPKHRPLRGRINVVLSRTPPPAAGDPDAPAPAAAAAGGGEAGAAPDGALPPGVLHAASLEAALALLAAPAMAERLGTVFVIGGGQVYAEALASERCAAVHLTAVEAEYEADTFFPPLPDRFRRVAPARPRRPAPAPRRRRRAAAQLSPTDSWALRRRPPLSMPWLSSS